MSLYKRWPLINFYTYKKIREIVIALLKRNLISAWPPMRKSDFHMTPHEEIMENLDFAIIWQVFLQKLF